MGKDTDASKLSRLAKQLAKHGAITTFQMIEDTIVVTITMGRKEWKTECGTTADAIEYLSTLLNENFIS
jgi:hypothetical protein